MLQPNKIIGKKKYLEKRWSLESGVVQDKEHSVEIDNLLKTSAYSDIILIASNGTRFPVHRMILAARSCYFASLLYGGMRESNEEEVKLGCSGDVLQIVLTFIYRGDVDLAECSVECLVHLLDQVRMMCLGCLENAVEKHLTNYLNGDDVSLNNALIILNVAAEKKIPSLIYSSRNVIEKNMENGFDQKSLLNLSPAGFKELLSSDNLDIKEIELFWIANNWIKTNLKLSKKKLNEKENYPKCYDIEDNLMKSAILSEIRLSQMTTTELFSQVRPSGMFTDTQILDAIECIEQNKIKTHKRKVIVNENVCLASLGAKVTKGQKCSQWSSINALLDGNTSHRTYSDHSGFTMQKLNERLEVKLGQVYKINNIKILLYDRDKYRCRYYSYRLDSSLDGVTWNQICDYSKYNCKSWQIIHFPERRMEYIGIVGTAIHCGPINSHPDKTPDSCIHVVTLEAQLDTKTINKKNLGMMKQRI